MRVSDFDPGALVTITAALELVVCLVAAIYFFVVGHQVIKQLDFSAGNISRSSRKNTLAARTTRYVIATGVLEILFIVVVALAVVPPLFWHPVGFYILLTLKDLFLFIISIVQILTFKWPPTGYQSTPSRTSTGVTEQRTANSRSNGLVLSDNHNV
jgi:hypothetical protein